jgi:hypothetical protein
VAGVRDGLRRAVAKARAIADPMVPRGRVRGAAGCGAGDFVEIGDDFFALFRRAGLERSHDVLDVGCGFGRMARPMVGWLEGRYEGFDVAPEPIESSPTSSRPSCCGTSMSCRGLSERGGTVFATYFLLDPEVERALGEGRTWRVMPHLESDPELGSYRLADRGAPSEAVAYRRDAVEAAHARRGLGVDAVWLGGWSGRPDGVTAHDVVVSRVG